MSNDFVSVLNKYYQDKANECNKEHKHNLRIILLNKQFEYIDANDNGKYFWRSIFICPFTKQQIESSCNNKNGDVEDGIFVETHFFHSTKKKAQKSAAMNACLQFSLSVACGDVGVGVGVGIQDKKKQQNVSTKNAITYGVSFLQDQDQTEIEANQKQKKFPSTQDPLPVTTDSSGKMKKKSLKHISKWIQNLYSHGVTSSGMVSVSFQQDYDCVLNDHNLRSFLQETKICCTIQLRNPIDLKITGPPCSTKKKAAQSAVLMIEHQLQKLHSGEKPSVENEKNNKNGDDEGLRKMEQLKETFNPKKKSTLCHYPLAQYLSSGVEIEDTMCMYEIRFKGAGFPWLRNDYEQNQKNSNCYTRMGIIFGSRNVEPPLLDHFSFISNSQHRTNYDGSNSSFSSVIQSIFEFSHDNKSLNIEVQLLNRTIIQGNAMSREQLKVIKKFNHTLLYEWKHYGLRYSKEGPKMRKKEEQEQSFQNVRSNPTGTTRGYLFVPLLDNKRENKNKHHKLKIDWALLSNVYDQKLTPLLKSLDFQLSSRCSPIFGRIDCYFLSFLFFQISILCFVPLVLHVVHFFAQSESFEFNRKEVDMSGMEQDFGLHFGYTCVIFSSFFFFLHHEHYPEWDMTKEVTFVDMIYMTGTKVFLDLIQTKEVFFVEVMNMIGIEQKFELHFGCSCVIFSIFFFFLHHAQYPKWNIAKEVLRNKFMIQSNAASSTSFLYVYNPPDKSHKDNIHKNCGSALLPMNTEITDSKHSYYLRNFNLDLKKATFGDYYYKKYGYQARFPTAQLLPVKSFTKHDALLDPTILTSASSAQDKDTVFILPELVKVLSMPRDVLYTFKYAHSFMPCLERELELLHVQYFLHTLSEKIALRLGNFHRSNKRYLSEQHTEKKHQTISQAPRSFLSLLKDATTVYPKVKYDVLEFVGDTILSYFFALNLFSRNAPLKWDVDDLEEMKNFGCKNECLAEKGLSCGIPRMIYAGYEWTHVCKPNIELSSQYKEFAKFDIDDKWIADVTEALLAVPFFGCETLNQASCMIIGILEELSLPFDNEERFGRTRSANWFTPKSSCLSQPYCFELDSPWLSEISQIRETLRQFSDPMGPESTKKYDLSKLEVGRLKLMQKFERMSKELDKKESRTLLSVALFDDSLHDEVVETIHTHEFVNNSEGKANYQHEKEQFEPPSELIRIALLRDTLFTIGNSALRLVLSAEMYTRYPTAKENDLHLLRTCAGECNDILAYIMIKNDVHLTLYDNLNNNLDKMILEADSLGRERWMQNGGWVIKPGIEEFRRRMKNTSRWLQISNPDGNNFSKAQPKYTGLLGGRFVGRKNKIESKLTDELAFSMKAIIGALVLSLGVENMWSCMLPLFEELFLLTPDELRTFGSTSSICSSYL